MVRPILRQGFTLVELLVSIAVIGVLISLLLPAVQAARESARRVQCLSNLKQVTLAVQTYESSQKKLPAAGSYAPVSEALSWNYGDWRIDLRSGTNFSWLCELLPYVEETALDDQLDRQRHITASPAEALAAQPPAFLCPSDSSVGRRFESAADFGLGPRSFGKANYAAYTNPFHIDSYLRSGPIALYGIPLRKVTDGTNSTIMLAEIRTRDDATDQRGAWALPWSGASLLSLDFHPTYYGGMQESDDKESADLEPALGSLGLTQTPNSRHPDVLYQCNGAAAAQLERMPCNASYWGYISAAPRSQHVGGVNAAFLDGHVNFLKDDIDELALHYMISVADGMVIEDQR